ncbi:MAG: hypothetical protein ABR600_03890 [Actinomycetota bacterium]
MAESPEKVVPLPVLKAGSIEDTLTGFAPQMEQNEHLGRRVERLVTVVSVEIRGWEPVREKVGEDGALDLLNQTLERVLRAIESLGGMEVSLGGEREQPTITATFDEDHALRGVVAGRAARDAATARLHPSIDERFHACVGVSSGTVVDTHVKGAGIEFQATGTVKLFAVRLQEFAGPDQVFVCEETYRSLSSYLDVVALGPVRTSGDGETRSAYCVRGLLGDGSE